MSQSLFQEADSPKKIHPHKMAMWIAMGSISMMFAGLTSGYMVRQSEGNWRYFKLPPIFWVSTIVIMVSSITYYVALKSFKTRKMPQFRALVGITLLLGILFGIFQYMGFYQLYHTPQPVSINGKITTAQEVVKISGNPSESFVFIIAGLHLLHILGGIIALLIVYLRVVRKNIIIYNATGLEIVGHYWHFVDILWVYLFVFFIANQ
ncbi:MAG: heme-copper oxidase subunit III [Chitinophagia bacterium]|nr:heme-copper oxidase subunit III [Chitinophagia bacterium]